MHESVDIVCAGDWLIEECVGDCINRDVGPDPESERDDRECGERRRSEKDADGVTEVCHRREGGTGEVGAPALWEASCRGSICPTPYAPSSCDRRRRFEAAAIVREWDPVCDIERRAAA